MTRENNIPQRIVAGMVKTYLSPESESNRVRLGAEILGAVQALTQLGPQYRSYAKEVHAVVEAFTPLGPYNSPIPHALRIPFDRGYRRIESTTSLDMHLHKA